MPPEPNSTGQKETFQNFEILGLIVRFQRQGKNFPARLDPGIGFEMAQTESFSFFIFLTKGLSPF